MISSASLDYIMKNSEVANYFHQALRSESDGSQVIGHINHTIYHFAVHSLTLIFLSSKIRNSGSAAERDKSRKKTNHLIWKFIQKQQNTSH